MLLYKQQQIKIINKRRKKRCQDIQNLQNIKHKKREKTMQKKGKIFTVIGRELVMAVKAGGRIRIITANFVM